MQRLGRITFCWLSAMSLLLFLLSCALWPASYYRSLRCSGQLQSADLTHNRTTEFRIDLFPGLINLSFDYSRYNAQRDEVDRREEKGIEGRSVYVKSQWDSYPVEPNWIAHEFHGFGFGFTRGGSGIDEVIEGIIFGSITPINSVFTECRLPLWFIALSAAMLPTISARRRLRSYRQRKYGLCANCNYDLRASPDVCPECGMKRQTYSPVKARPLASLMLVFATIALIIAAVLCAVSNSRAFQVSVDASVETAELDINRAAHLTICDGVFVTDAHRSVVPLQGGALEKREKTGPLPGDLTIEATWQPRDEHGYFNAEGDLLVDHFSHNFGYTLDHGQRSSIEYLWGHVRPTKWFYAALRLPMWFVVLLAAVFPGYRLVRLLVGLRSARS